MAAWPYNTAAWKRLRLAKLSAVPLCEVCERRGRLNTARHVDHIIAVISQQIVANHKPCIPTAVWQHNLWFGRVGLRLTQIHRHMLIFTGQREANPAIPGVSESSGRSDRDELGVSQ